MKSFTAGLIITFSLINGVLVKATDTKAVKILMEANEALNEVSGITYDFTYHGSGKLFGNFSGEVKLKKQASFIQSWIYTRMNFLKEKSINQDDIENTWWISVLEGSITLYDLERKQVRNGTLAGGSMNLMTYAYYAVLFQYLQKDPFLKDSENETLQYVGQESMAGIICEVVRLKNPYDDWVFWYIGKEDRLIHGQKTENTGIKTEGSFQFTMMNLQINPELTKNDFEIISDKSATRIDEDSKIIAVGEPAPGWQITDRHGKMITSKEFKGKVVLLDFWASWCNPCWQIMPIVNKLASSYKNLFVLGINVWENPARDPYKYMKNENLNYQTVVDGDILLATNFKIAFLPVLVLIDSDGIIRHVSNGYSADLESNLKSAIEESLK